MPVIMGLGGIAGAASRRNTAEAMISASDGTIIGDFTLSGIQGRAFNGLTDEAFLFCARCAALAGFIGKDYGTAKAYTRGVVYGSNNSGFSGNVANPSPRTVTIKIRGSNSAPSSRTDGTEIGSLAPFTESVNENGGREVTVTDPWTKYRYVWFDEVVQAGTSGTAIVNAECVFYENTNA